MRIVALAILILAVVIGVVGWRATEHHKQNCDDLNGSARLSCVLQQ